MEPEGTGVGTPRAAGFRTIAGQVDHRALPALLTAFSAGALDRLARLADAAAAGHREAFLQVLHALRGSAGSFGADALADACASMERRARDDEPLDAIAADLVAIEAEVDAAVAGMRSVLVELGVP